MSWPTKAIYWYVTTKVCDAKFAICAEHTSKSDFEQSPLCATAKRRRGHLPIPKQEKTAHQHVSKKLVSLLDQSGARNKRPINTTSKNSCIAFLWVIGTSSAHTVTRNITPCLFLLSPNLISHTLINVVTTPFRKRPSRVAKVIMF